MPNRACRVFLMSLVLGAVLVGCSSGSGAKPTPTPPPPITVDAAANRGQYGVGVTTLDLDDTTRPTVANRDAPASPDRRMAVEVWYPAAPSTTSPEQRDVPIDATGGPYPLIIFAHGFTAFRRQSASYMQQLASHGYIVASPDFPQSRSDTPGGPRISAVLDQPADVSFVIDEMLKRGAPSGSGPFSGAIDADKIGMTGHSLGGLTTMLTAYGPLRDPRIKAIAPISPVGCFLPPNAGAGVSLPVMVIGGSRERIVDPSTMRFAYDGASSPKYWVQIIGADHIRFADVNITDDQFGGAQALDTASRGDLVGDALKIAQATGADATKCLVHNPSSDELIEGDRQRELLRTVATPFFDAYLKGDAASLRFLRETLPTLPSIRFEAQP